MVNSEYKPELIIIAGPNGSGKTSVTQKFLHHEWAEGITYINPDQVAKDKIDFVIRAKKAGFFIRIFFISTEDPSINASRIAKRVMKGGHDVPITKIISRYNKSILNCKIVSSIVDRLYVYDNSIDNIEAKALFRLSSGQLIKQYEPIIPEWAKNLLNT